MAGEGGTAENVEQEVVLPSLPAESPPQWQVGYSGSMWTPAGMLAIAKFRLASFRNRFCLEELSGALGDMGTLIPLVAACAKAGSLRLGPAMFWLGVFNIISALQWDIPMPVQPMKSISAVAIADGLSPGAFAASGIITGGVVWILGITKLVDLVNRVISRSVISGMQLGLGLNMAATGCGYWRQSDWLELDGKITGLVCFVATAALMVHNRMPTALIIFVAGMGIMGASAAAAGAGFRFEVLSFPVIVPTRDEWLTGFFKGALPQLPLTTLNSVVSICALSVDLFRDPQEGGKGVSRVSVASSVGFMNVIGCWFGGMPACHGAGGLAGQYKFGARGGCSILMLGVAKVVLALVLGQSLDVAMDYYPRVVLGVLLLFSGVELAAVGLRALLKSSALEDDMVPALVTTAAYLGVKNMAIGVCAGILVSSLQTAADRWGVGPFARLAQRRGAGCGC